MPANWLLRYLIIFLTAAFITYLVCFPAKFLARRIGIIDQPNTHKIHKNPTPRNGGVALFIGFGLSLVLFNYISGGILSTPIWSVLIGAALTFMVGFLDDLRVNSGGIPTVLKLLTLCVVTLILAYAGIVVSFPFPTWLSIIITLLWLIGVTSAFNAFDNMDGLAGGLALIASLTYLAVAATTGQWLWGTVSAALAGANLGFLRHNFYPASIFMGDGGSFFLGFTLATLGIMGGWSTNPFKAALVPIIILGIPLFDLAYIIIKRQLKGVTKNLKEIIVYCGRDHFSHRLQSLGLSQLQVVLFVYLLVLATSLGAIILRETPRLEAIILLVQFLLIAAVIFIIVEIRAAKYENSSPYRPER